MLVFTALLALILHLNSQLIAQVIHLEPTCITDPNPWYLAAEFRRLRPETPDLTPLLPKNNKKATRPPSPRTAPITHRVTCQRRFRLLDRTFAMDSFNARDGEGIRPLANNVPEAITELNHYQANQVRARTAAITGSAGIFLVIITQIIASSQTGAEQAAIGGFGRILGFGLASGSLLFSIANLNSNEDHLTRAIDAVNRANPDQIIKKNPTIE